MNQYHIYEEISRRRGCVVYKGRIRDSISYVAVKGVDKEYQHLAENEVKMMYNLHHPNILKFINWYATSKHVWLILEYCTGGSLLNIIQQDIALPDESIRVFARALCSGLHYVHSKGLVYCDLKPSTIVFDSVGELKLADFSFATPAATAATTKQSVGRRGSPWYMAPELFDTGGGGGGGGGGGWTYATDIWALGCVLYEMAQGQPPYVEHDIPKLMRVLLSNDPVPRITATSPPPAAHARGEALMDLIARCLVKDPNTRATWTDIMSHSFWEGNPPPHTPTTPTPLPPPAAAAAALTSSSSSSTVTRQVSNEEVMRFAANAYRNNDAQDEETYDVAMDNHARVDSGWDAELNFNDYEAPGSPLPPAEAPIVPPTPSGMGLKYVSDEEELLPPSTPASTAPTSVRPQTAATPSGMSSRSPTSTPPRPRRHQCQVLPVSPPPPSSHQQQQQQQRAQTAKRTPTPTTTTTTTTTAAAASSNTHPHHISKTPSSASSAAVAPSTVPAVPVYDEQLRALVVDTSDLVVHPLVDNARIDKRAATGPIQFNASALPCAALSSDDVWAMDKPALDAHLRSVVHGVRDFQFVEQCEASLLYLQSLCRHPQLATMILNSAIQPVLLNILHSYPPNDENGVRFRAHLLHVIGLQIRYASTIDASIGYNDIVAALSVHIEHADVMVRRWSVAALGEFLFYVSIEAATQKWQVSASTFHLITWCLRDGEDATVQHYAVKTIENISAQSGPWSHVFCESSTLESVLHIYTHTARPALKRIAASVLFHLSYRSARMLTAVAEKLGSAGIYEGLSDRSVHMQRVFLNIFNVMLLNKHHAPRAVINDAMCDRLLVPRLLKLAENPSVIIRTKVVVALCLIGNTDLIWLHRCCQCKCLSVLERLRLTTTTTTATTATTTALAAAVDMFVYLCGVWIERALAGLNDVASKLIDVKYAPAASLKSYRRCVARFKLFNQFLGSDLSRSRVCNSNNIVVLAGLLRLVRRLVFAESVQWKRSLLTTVESLIRDQASLRAHTTDIIEYLLPALLTLLENESAELRFTSLKVLSDAVVRMMRDSMVYSASAHEAAMNAFICDLLLPSFGHLLQDAVPMPQYCLKLLFELVDTQRNFIPVVHRLGLVPQLLIMFAPLKNNSVYSVNLVRHLVLSKDISNTELCDRGLLTQLHVILDYALDNAVSWYHEPLLDMVYHVVFAASGELQRGDVYVNADQVLARYEPLLSIVPLLFRYLDAQTSTSFSHHVRDLAVRCLLLLARLYPTNLSLFITTAHIRILLECVSSTSTSSGSNSNAAVTIPTTSDATAAATANITSAATAAWQQRLLKLLSTLSGSPLMSRVLAHDETLATDFARLMNDVASSCLVSASPSHANDDDGDEEEDGGGSGDDDDDDDGGDGAEGGGGGIDDKQQRQRHPQPRHVRKKSAHHTRLNSAEIAHKLQQFATNAVFN